MPWSQSLPVANQVLSSQSCEITMPQITGRQQHRSNPPSANPLDYKRTVAIPFLDFIVSSLEERFSRSAVIATSLLSLVPSVLWTQDVILESVVDSYRQDIDSPELLPAEIHRWKSRYLSMLEKPMPTSPTQVIEECDKDLFPNISTLLQIARTIPVTSCECERSLSALRQLHNYLRASMKTKRLSSLALLHIHYDDELDLDEAVSILAKLHPRRIELDNLSLLSY